MCQPNLTSTRVTNTFCWRNILKPGQATGLANYDGMVQIKLQISIFLLFNFASNHLLRNIPADTLLHRGLAPKLLRGGFWLMQYGMWGSVIVEPRSHFPPGSRTTQHHVLQRCVSEYVLRPPDTQTFGEQV